MTAAKWLGGYIILWLILIAMSEHTEFGEIAGALTLLISGSVTAHYLTDKSTPTKIDGSLQQHIGELI